MGRATLRALRCTGSAVAMVLLPKETPPEDSEDVKATTDGAEGAKEESTKDDTAEAKDDEAMSADAKEQAEALDKAKAELEEEGEDDDDEADEKEAPSPKKEKPPELEVDAEPDDRERVKQPVVLSSYDSTLDIFCSEGGTMVSSLSEGACQYLLSGVRATTGAKAGRYFFEVKVLERKWTEEPRNVLRVGVTTAKSSVFIGDGTPDGAGFEMNGTFFAPTVEDPKKKKTGVFYNKREKRVLLTGQVLGVLLNLKSEGPNANTLSVFIDGVRLGEPQPLPPQLVGKALYPTLTFQNYVLAVNFGSGGLMMKKLPFTCRMMGDIAAADAESASYVPSSTGVYSVVVPVGLPDQGFFDYVDHFLERHPDYVELSDRKLIEWCTKSGLEQWKSNASSSERPPSRDRPHFNFGKHHIDKKRDWRGVLKSVSQLTKRNYIIAELKENLSSQDRAEVLERFGASHFSVAAHVVVGEPAADHKEWVHAQIRAAYEKKQAEEREKAKKAEERRKIGEERKQRIAEQKKKKAEAKEKVKKEDEEDDKDAVKKEEKIEDVKAEEDAAPDGEPPAKKQKLNEGDKDEAPTAEDAPDAASVKEDAGPNVGPDVWYVPAHSIPDVDEKTLGLSYSDFSIPSADEGFAKVDFVWQPRESTEDHVKKWRSDLKVTLKMEDLKPGEWFKEKSEAFKKQFKEMQQKIKDAKKAKKPESEKEKSKEKPKVEDKDPPEEPSEASPEAPAEPEAPPVYASFQYEDWALLRWRFELHLLVHGFLTDVEDGEFIGVPTKHIAFYYQLYWKQHFSPSNLGCKSFNEVVAMMDDTFKTEEKGKGRFLKSLFEKDADFDKFVDLVEEARLDRTRRIEAGDESAVLEIPRADVRAVRSDGKSKGKKGKGKGTQVKRLSQGGASSALKETRTSLAQKRTMKTWAGSFKLRKQVQTTANVRRWGSGAQVAVRQVPWNRNREWGKGGQGKRAPPPPPPSTRNSWDSGRKGQKAHSSGKDNRQQSKGKGGGYKGGDWKRPRYNDGSASVQRYPAAGVQRSAAPQKSSWGPPPVGRTRDVQRAAPAALPPPVSSRSQAPRERPHSGNSHRDAGSSYREGSIRTPNDRSSGPPRTGSSKGSSKGGGAPSGGSKGGSSHSGSRHTDDRRSGEGRTTSSKGPSRAPDGHSRGPNSSGADRRGDRDRAGAGSERRDRDRRESDRADRGGSSRGGYSGGGREHSGGKSYPSSGGDRGRDFSSRR